MIDNRISAVMPQEDFDAILGAVSQIRSRMPFLTNSSPAERRSRGFIVRALEVATQNPDIVPLLFSLEEMRKDVELSHKLQQIQLSLNQLQEVINSTSILVESESYAAALAVYGYAKSSGKVAALQEAMTDLGRRFTRKQSNPAIIDPPTTPSDSPFASAHSIPTK